MRECTISDLAVLDIRLSLHHLTKESYVYVSETCARVVKKENEFQANVMRRRRLGKVGRI